MNQVEVAAAARLESIYSSFRKLQAVHDEFETRCIGAGNCCKVGLYIPLLECWNIARHIKREYWLHSESQGRDYANGWYDRKIKDLKDAFVNQADWDVAIQETEAHCAFSDPNAGCTIYEQRPLVCRVYGVTAPVQEGVCPRKRLPDGNVELIVNEQTEALLDGFDSLVAEWSKAMPALRYTIYMPAGVLSFLLDEEERQQLMEETDPKFWMADEGYSTHRLRSGNWGTPVTLRSEK